MKFNDLNEGYSVLPNIDTDRYGDRSGEGLEGPFRAGNGKVVYYDAKAGMYYDPDTDFYLSYDEWKEMNESVTEKVKIGESTDLGTIGNVHINQFAGGKSRGLMVQLTSAEGTGYIQMDKNQAQKVCDRLSKWITSGVQQGEYFNESEMSAMDRAIKSIETSFSPERKAQSDRAITLSRAAEMQSSERHASKGLEMANVSSIQQLAAELKKMIASETQADKDEFVYGADRNVEMMKRALDSLGMTEAHVNTGSQKKFKRSELEAELGHEEKLNNFEVVINGKPWKVFPTKAIANKIAQKILAKRDVEVQVYATLKPVSETVNEGPRSSAYDVDPKLMPYVKMGQKIASALEPSSGLKWDDEEFNKAAILGSEFSKLGSAFGPKTPGEALKAAGVDLDMAKAIIAKVKAANVVPGAGVKDPDRQSSINEQALTEEQFDEAAGEKDACYHKVKSRYKVWPSAYASGALVKCRKVGAKNWGNKK